MNRIDYKNFTAQQLIDHARQAGVHFIAGSWLGRGAADPSVVCACAVGEYALMQGYVPTVMREAYGTVLWEDSQALFTYLLERGVPHDFLEGLSTGYEEAFFQGRYPVPQGDFEHGFNVGRETRLLLKEAVIDAEDFEERVKTGEVLA